MVGRQLANFGTRGDSRKRALDLSIVIGPESLMRCQTEYCAMEYTLVPVTDRSDCSEAVWSRIGVTGYLHKSQVRT